MWEDGGHAIACARSRPLALICTAVSQTAGAIEIIEFS
jgi:hypothetical protein